MLCKQAIRKNVTTVKERPTKRDTMMIFSESNSHGSNIKSQAQKLIIHRTRENTKIH